MKKCNFQSDVISCNLKWPIAPTSDLVPNSRKKAIPPPAGDCVDIEEPVHIVDELSLNLAVCLI